MEYRLRYRDLPWSVALAALPGKIIGGYLIRPTEAIADDPMHYVAKFAKFLLFVVLVLALSLLITIGIDLATRGSLGLKKSFDKAMIESHKRSEAEKRARAMIKLKNMQYTIDEARKAQEAAKCKVKDAIGRCR